MGFSPEDYDVPGAERFGFREGDGDLSVGGRGKGASGGVLDHGTQQEDNPGTWEAQVPPRTYPVRTETR